MTDRYTDLVKTAYEAQQAREGEGYVKLTTELAVIDNQLEALAASRETTVAALEAMDEAVEAAKEALDAYFAGREEGDEELFEGESFGASGFLAAAQEIAQANEMNRLRTAGVVYGSDPVTMRVIDDASEFETARATGAYSDDLQDFTPPARAD